MPNINGWAAKAAEGISSEFPSIKFPDMLPSDERIAAIIATFAEPLVALLREARREHFHSERDTLDCCPQCRRDLGLPGYKCTGGWPKDGSCTCGASKWNARIDAALAGEPITPDISKG